MADLIKFSESSTIGLHAMLHLAANAQEGPVQMRVVAEAYRVSEAHLAKVMQRLGKAGLVRAFRGPSGGYMLCEPPEQVTLLRVYEAIEGEVAIRHCLFGQAVCFSGCCDLGSLVGKLTGELRDYMARATLAEVVGKAVPAGSA